MVAHFRRNNHFLCFEAEIETLDVFYMALKPAFERKITYSENP